MWAGALPCCEKIGAGDLYQATVAAAKRLGFPTNCVPFPVGHCPVVTQADACLSASDDEQDDDEDIPPSRAHGTLPPLGTSASFLAELSVRSSPNNNYCHYLNIIFWIKTFKRIFNLILKTEALLGTG